MQTDTEEYVRFLLTETRRAFNFEGTNRLILRNPIDTNSEYHDEIAPFLGKTWEQISTDMFQSSSYVLCFVETESIAFLVGALMNCCLVEQQYENDLFDNLFPGFGLIPTDDYVRDIGDGLSIDQCVVFAKFLKFRARILFEDSRYYGSGYANALLKYKKVSDQLKN